VKYFTAIYMQDDHNNLIRKWRRHMPDDQQTPSADNGSSPTDLTQRHQVPADLVAAGHDTNDDTQTDSPETLDEEISTSPDDATMNSDHTLRQSTGDPTNKDLDRNHDGIIEPNETTEGPLPEDYDTPFSDPDDIANDTTDDELVEQRRSDAVDDTHQVFDSASDIEPEERYDEGLAGAAEVEEPNAGNTVTGYNPDKDTRKKAA
jgi:hypothetical protein